MDDKGQRENGRSRAEQYRAAQNQWLMQHHQPTVKQIMAIMAERDAAIQERNLALSEKKTAMVERDMAILQRDNAINERNNAMMERDNALATIHYRDNPMNGDNNDMSHSQIQTRCPPGCQISRGSKHVHHPIHHVHDEGQQVNETPYNSMDLQISDDIPLSPVASEAAKSRGNKRTKESKSTLSSKKIAKNAKKVKRESDGLDKLQFGKSHEWKDGHDIGSGSDVVGKQIVVSKSNWKEQDLGLNLVVYDDTTMPPPVCSCTGIFRQCYKWGSGGWQSSCCTMSISLYPLPSVPNKRHARVGGRKMSGGAYNKLLTRLAQAGHDLSNPVDLKDNWAKHGTNRYITIK